MADEIISKLGFDVAQALSALQQLDSRLQTSSTALQAHATQLYAWNSTAQAALATMRALASASAKLAAMPAVAPAAAAAAPAAPSFWLPPGVQSQVAQTTQAMSSLASTSTTAGTVMANAGNNAANAIAGANKQAKLFSVSWEMMGRIIVTQMLVRALSQIRDALKEAVVSAIEFQRAISEIKIIAPLTATFQSLQDEAAELSRSFNIPLPQVAEGLYQTISDQFVEVSDRSNVMRAAMMFARAGVMDLGSAVELLTGTLNAYGISSANAEIVATKFFETIKLGRVRGEELADTMGQVMPIAAQVGVSLDELNAAFVSMTIGGLDAHKTATGLRQAMVAFLKPSEDMKKVLRELGYSNAEQIIQAKGFIGALQAISEASGNMTSEIVKSFRNVRALTAELSLTRDGAKKYEEALKAMGEVGAESLKKLYEEFRSMPAEKLTAEVNKLKVTMTRDFGNMAVEVLGSIVQLAGGANKLSAALQALAGVGVILGGVLVALAVKALIAQAALGPIGWALLAIGAAITAFVGAGIYESAIEVAQIREAAEARRTASLERIQQAEEVMRKEREIRQKAREEENKSWEEGVTVLRKQYFKAMDALKEENKVLVEDSRTTMSSMISAQGRVVAAYRNAANAAAEAVRASRERQTNAESAYSDAVFKYATKNEGAYSKAESYMRRAWQLAMQAAGAMKKAKIPEEIATAQAIFQRADAAAQQAEQIANGTNNIMLQEDAERIVLSVMQQKISAEKALQQIQSAEAAKLAAKAASEQSRLNEMKSLMKAILTDLEAFDKTGAKEPKALEEQQRRLSANMKRMRELWLTGAKVDVSDLLAMDKLQQRVRLAMEGGVEEIEVRKLFAVPDTFARFRADIERGVGPIKVLLETAIPALPPGLQKVLKESTAEEAISRLSAEMQRTNRIISQHEEMADTLRTANLTLDESMTSAKAGMNEWIRREFLIKDIGTLRFWGMPLGFYEDTKTAIEGFRDQINRFLTMPKAALDTKAFQDLQNAYKKYLEIVKPSDASKAALDQFIRDAGAAVSSAEQVAKLREGLGETEKEAAEAARVRPALQQAYEAAQRAAEAARQAQQGAIGAQTSAAAARGEVTAVAQIDMSGFTMQVNSAASAMWNLAYASASVKTPVAPAEIAAMGGRAGRYLAGGGPVGMDVVPAWLSRGEFVMNTEATRRFASQLVAMNAGIQPTFRGEGGSVTNVGDISVSVQGGATGRQTARSIAAELRRELRRRTMKPL